MLSSAGASSVASSRQLCSTPLPCYIFRTGVIGRLQYPLSSASHSPAPIEVAEAAVHQTKAIADLTSPLNVGGHTFTAAAAAPSQCSTSLACLVSRQPAIPPKNGGSFLLTITVPITASSPAMQLQDLVDALNTSLVQSVFSMAAAPASDGDGTADAAAASAAAPCHAEVEWGLSAQVSDFREQALTDLSLPLRSVARCNGELRIHAVARQK